MKKNLIIILTFASLLMSFGSTVITRSYLKGVGYVKLKEVASYYNMRFRVSGSNKYHLESKWTKIQMTKGSRRCKINGNLIHFSHGPDKIGSYPAIAEKDFLKLIDPIIRRGALRNLPIRRIIIDPGHGGKDQGAAGKLYKEKAVVLEVAKRLEAKLKAYGYKVYKTRNGDSFPSLNNRCNFMKREKGDIFISLHCNSASATAKGIETFFLTPKGASSTSGGSTRKKSTRANSYDNYNAKLAYEVQKALVNKVNGTNRGIKHAQFYVLSNASCPSILVELGFLSHRGEERLLGSKSYQDKLAQGITQGVVAYIAALRNK